jgi:hypothetical protein
MFHAPLGSTPILQAPNTSRVTRARVPTQLASLYKCISLNTFNPLNHYRLLPFNECLDRAISIACRIIESRQR